MSKSYYCTGVLYPYVEILKIVRSLPCLISQIPEISTVQY